MNVHTRRGIVRWVVFATAGPGSYAERRTQFGTVRYLKRDRASRPDPRLPWEQIRGPFYGGTVSSFHVAATGYRLRRFGK
jgi:hypothetical protein